MMMIKTGRSACWLLFMIMLPGVARAQAREKRSLNSGWSFILSDYPDPGSPGWQKINLPHTWNAADIIDDTVGYYRGIGWYQRPVYFSEEESRRQVRLFIEGAGIKVTVYLNGQVAAEHAGSYTGFWADLTPYIRPGQANNLQVKVDNSKHLSDSIPPFSGDFSMMGGLYRDCWLVISNPILFENRELGSDGIRFTTPQVSERSAAFQISTKITGLTENFSGNITYYLLSKGDTITAGLATIKKTETGVYELKGRLEKPLLWSPEAPNLYQLIVQLKNDKKELMDEWSGHVGFKWTGISDKKEFLLNGKPYKLKGASRHQDYYGVGHALTDAMHVRDLELMKEMGCNFIRIAHYPQDPAIYDACDRLGLISWSEIPVVDKVVAGEAFRRHSAQMMREMIAQHINHPSIAIWGYHNEVRNLDTVSINNARMLNAIAKEADPQRLTAIAFESNLDAPYFKNPLLSTMLNIADINGYNVYQGWYRGKHEDIGAFMDTLYDFNPKKPIMLSEYGAGSIINIHTCQPTLFDFSEEYQCDFHASYVKAGNDRPWMTGFAIWNFIDFQRDGREDVIPHINKKGMVTTDRHPKDVFYYYRSQWDKKPFVYIAGKHWISRIGFTDGTQRSIIVPLKVYSNQPKLMLYQDGAELGYIESKNGVFEWEVNLSHGENRFLVQSEGGVHSDVIRIQCDLIDTTTFAADRTWRQLNFNTGQTRTFFTDTKSNEQWIPDKPYTKGTWGYVGGSPWNSWSSPAWNGIREGIHKPIANTLSEPLFQTFVEGLSGWKADVPDGRYRVSVLLCEPFTARQRDNKERIFDLYLNEKTWEQHVNLEKQYGVQSAVIFDKEVEARNNEGITISYIMKAGQSILNGVRLQKL